MKKAYTIAAIGVLLGVEMIIFGLSIKKNLLSKNN